jgi:hypothetical protein
MMMIDDGIAQSVCHAPDRSSSSPGTRDPMNFGESLRPLRSNSPNLGVGASREAPADQPKVKS